MPVFAAARLEWYLTRSTGTVALVLLTAIVVLGVLGPLRMQGTARWPRFTVGALHRDLSLLALAALAVHIATSVLDGFAPIGWLDAVVPLHSAYRPVWLGLGTAAFDLLLALVITSLVRRRLGYERWQRLHWLAYACWPLAITHGLGTGSDASAGWMVLITLGCLAVTVTAVLARVTRAGLANDRTRAVSFAAPTAVGLVVIAFALIGPWQPGWAARAGTPAALLHHHAPPAHAPKRFTAILSGRERRHAVPGGTLLDLTLALRGTDPGTMRIRLAGHPAGQGVSLVGSQVDLSAPELGGVFQGGVSRLSGGEVRADLRQTGGHGWRVVLHLTVDRASGTVAGRVDGAVL